MMRKIILLLFVCSLFINRVHAQTIFSQISRTTTSFVQLHESKSIINSSNELISVGAVNTSGLKGYFAKFDLSGNFIDGKITDEISGSIATQIKSIEEYANGDYIITGVTGSALLAQRIDANGNIIWDKEFSNSDAFSLMEDNNVSSTIIDGTDTYVGYGSYYEDNATPWPFEVYIYYNLMKLDVNGDTLWTTKATFDESLFSAYNGLNTQSTFVEMLQLSNGNILIVGKTKSVGTQEESIILNYFNTAGTFLQSKEIPLENGTYAKISNVIETSSNELQFFGILNNFSGTTYDGTMYFNTDLDGNFISGTMINDNPNGKIIGVETLDGGLMLGSSNNTTTGFIFGRLTLYKLDSSGNFIWGRNYGGAGNDVVSSIHEFSNRNIIITGKTTSFHPSTNNDHYMLGLDSLGVTAKCQDDVTYSSEPFTLTLNSVSPTITRGNTFTTMTFNQTTLSLVSVDIGYEVTDSIIEPLCYGGLGGIDVALSGANTPATYDWSDGSSGEDLVNSIAGVYTVKVLDLQKCINVKTFILSEPAILSATYTTTNVNCFGFANGAIDITVNGGTPGYTYDWTNLSTTEDLTNLSGGFYQVIISDTNNCQKTIGVSVTEPQPLISVITKTTHTSCNNSCDGELVCFASGGYAPYTYLWNDPLSQITDTAIALCNAQYLVSVTDINGCITYSNGTVLDPPPLLSTISSTPSECGLSIGAANVSVGGGTMPYQYLWSNASVIDTAVGLGQGMYGVTITDTNGCVIIDSVDIQTTTAPAEICVVTVSDQNQNVVVWEKPVVNNVAGYNIYRNIAGTYSQIGYNPYDSLSQFVDLTFGVDPNVTSYRYKISVIDTCGGESDLSNYHETIHLTTNVGVGGEVNLIWDDYEGFPFVSYNLLLDSTGTGNYFVLANVPNTNFTYTDFNPPMDSADYIIEVVIPAGCISTKANHNTTRSNRGKPSSSVVGMEDLYLKQSKIYPNPTNTRLNIELKGANSWEYKVFNMTGKLIEEKSEINMEKETLNVENWTNGIYLIQLRIGEKFINRKIVKQ